MESLVIAFVLQLYGVTNGAVLVWQYDDVITCVESSTNLVNWRVVTNMPATVFYPVPKDNRQEFFRVSRFRQP